MTDGRPAIEEVVTDALPLSRAAMAEVGPAAITLGALHRLCGRKQGYSTFAQLALIGEAACIGQERTVRRHLSTLRAAGWIEWRGREALNQYTKRPRRTNTWALTEKAHRHQKPFEPLPRWAAKYLHEHQFGWAAIAVFAVLCGEQSLRNTIDGVGDSGDYLDANTSRTARKAGLTRTSVIAGRERLLRAGLVEFGDGELSIHPGVMIPDSYFPGSILTRPAERSGRKKCPGWVSKSVQGRCPEVSGVGVQKCPPPCPDVSTAINSNLERESLNGNSVTKIRNDNGSGKRTRSLASQNAIQGQESQEAYAQSQRDIARALAEQDAARRPA